MFRGSIVIRFLLLAGLVVCVSSARAGIWTEPDSFDVSITEGCTATDTLTVGNDGSGVLNFTVRPHIVGGAAGFATFDNGIRGQAGGSWGASVGIDRLSDAAKAVVSSGRAGLDFTVQSNVPHKPDELIVRFAPKAGGRQLNLEEKHSVLSSLAGAKVKWEFKLVPGLSVVKLPSGMTVEKAVQTLSKANGILYAHPNYEVQAVSTFPNDPRFNELWGMHNTGQTGGTPDADIDAPEAWDIGMGSRDIIVAVIDTGVDYTHPDMAANMWVNQAEYSGTPGVDDDHNGFVDDIYGYDFYNDDSDPRDDNGHGTHCSGTIGGIGNNGVGVAGVCWNVKIMALKFLSSGGSGNTDDAIQCFEYAVEMGANVTSNSWAGTGYDQGLKDAIEAAGAAGQLCVAAAANSNVNIDINPYYPAAYDSPCIISVMATDNGDQKASFSNYGPIGVDLGAPGVDILSCQPGGGYQLLSGTSMATPHVAGACALLWSMNPGMSNSEVKDILLRTVDPTLAGLCVSGGRLNLYKAICETEVPWLTVDPNEGTIGPGESTDIDVTFDAMELAPGVYEAEIIISSNDPGGTKVVPVTMTVNADALEVFPAGGFESSGSKGGPFEPEKIVYHLTNTGGVSINWTTLPMEDWLTVSPPAGVLEPASSIDVNVCINANANLLDPNVYSQVLTFQNLDSGSIKTRSIVLTVSPPDLFTESFNAGGNFEGVSVTFLPNGSIAGYEACRDEASEFPTDPNGGTYLPLGDDDFAQVVLADGKEVWFYGQSYDRFYVGSNGYITFGAGDNEFAGTLENHFALPRISGYFTDLTPATSQDISFIQLEDRVAVTFKDVPIFGDKNAKNSFQIEIFFGDGAIRITWLELAVVEGVAGLSEGYGLPPELFEESDFRGYPICWPFGDFDKDYDVDLADLGIFVSYWLNADCNYPMWCDRTDLDFSSDVEGVDFSIFAWNWGVVKSTMPSPISYWRFDEGTGTVAYDSMGTNHGNISGATWAMGQVNGALSFDGVNDYVTVPDNESQQIKTNQITLSAWIWLAADIGNTQRRIICKQQTSPRSWGLEIAGNGYGGATGNQLNFHDSSGTTFYNCMSQTHLELHRWYHVAVTDNAGEIRIYIDGLPDKACDGGYGIPAQIAAPIMIGRTNPDSTFYFKGVIDEVRFYDVALSAEEIEQLYQGGLSYKAFNPKPADGETAVDPNAVLSWKPGKDVLTHNVYFGTNFNEVNDADGSNPDIYMGGVDVNYWDVRDYDSNGLEPGTTFYWRIDEAGAAITAKGDVWTFRTAVASGFVSWWKFDEGTGTIAYDSAGYNDGQLMNGPVWTNGYIDGGLRFDGVNDYVDVPDDSSLRFTQYDSFTFAMWVNPITTSSDAGAFICKMRTGGQHNIFGYLAQWNTTIQRFDFAADCSNEAYTAVSTPNNSAPPGSWYHVVCVYDNRDMKIYLNGQLKDTDTFTGGTGTSSPDNNLSIGARIVDSTVDTFFGGMLDDIRIYNKALSAEEIEQLYQGGLSYKAFNPKPADGETAVDPNAVLSWKPGKDVLTHNVYFGTNFNEVNDADGSNPDIYMGGVDVNYWDVRDYDSNGLEPGTTFYWRIDEAGAAITAKGDVWSFRTIPAGIDSNLVGWWLLNEGSGNIAGDSSGNEYDGTISGATWFNDPIRAVCLSFDGSGDYVSISDNPALDITGDITISAWAYFASGGGSAQGIVTKTSGNGSRNNPFDFRTEGMSLTLVRADASGHEFVYSTKPMSTQQWHHVLVRVENKVPDFYVDGIITGKTIPSFTKTPTGNAKPLLIGRRDDGLYLTGKIDSVRIYNRALSAAEIWQLYQSGL